MELLRSPVRSFSLPFSLFLHDVHRAAPRLNIRFRLFLAIFIHSRGQIIRESAATVELARSFEREIAFSRGKISQPVVRKKSRLYFGA